MEQITGNHPLSKSANIIKENVDALKSLFPTIVKEGKIDVDELKALLGEEVEVSEEYYRFMWAGKSQARQEANKPSTGTLRPVKEESKDWDSTQNIFIEGDNLEVLKLLQKSYANRIKMIYIDPPYNTGKDFVYKDNYADNLGNYLAITKQIDEEGKRLSTNLETDGRYHSNWLNMMYPRLKLSRNLLVDDGVIFISINDIEVHSLLAIMNEIFGEENRIATLIWDKGHSAQAGVFKVYHEYVLVYAKNIEQVGVPNSSNNDHFEAGAMKRESNRHPMSEFTFPPGVRFDAPNGTELKGSWGGTEKVELIKGRMVAENGVTKYEVTLRAAYTQKNQMDQFFYGDKSSLVDSRGQKVVNFYFNSSGKIKIVKERGVYTPDTTLSYGTQSAASGELAELFDFTETPIDNPKPVQMIKDFILWFTGVDDIILDFFAGSATTAHATMEVNAAGGRRHFICIQLPESIEEGKEPYQAGFKTISDLAKARIEKASALINSEIDNSIIPEKTVDIGYRFFKLFNSNIKAWDGRLDNLEQNLLSAAENINPDRTEDDVLYEILLKSGLDLAQPIEEKKIAGKKVFNIGLGALFICLANKLDTSVADGIGKWKQELEPSTCRVIFKDTGFNDVEKTNSIQILKRYGINEVNTI